VFRRKRSAEDFAEEKGEKPPVLSLADAKSFPGYDQQYGKPLHLLMAMVGLCF
jgi:hypothetical protein